MSAHDKGPLLGQQVSGSESYDPSLLFPVPRANARSTLRDARFEGFGEDLWHAYELSWLSPSGMPQMYTAVLRVPCSSTSIVESKSLKLYLNSLNNHRFASAEEARATIEVDVGRVVDAPVSLELFGPDDPAMSGCAVDAQCLDTLEVAIPETPDKARLRAEPGAQMRVCTHLMRSRCPVTDQPDWATVVIETRGVAAEREGLLAYLLAYRNHQEFHEQCVERIYTDLKTQLAPEFLSVHALYTRRGGIDICPWRCSEPLPAPNYRMHRQ
ncbi:MAG: NADPH-dependent 7-cyano-7-deazaguanine reductase QueF [Halieaceae bacterium]|nr:NADPH-dependent 7-cyano-7-deazaguanine reductase QueF [Halieaceae bacterium]